MSNRLNSGKDLGQPVEPTATPLPQLNRLRNRRRATQEAEARQRAEEEARRLAMLQRPTAGYD